MLPEAACLFVADRRNVRAFLAPQAAPSILRLAFWDWQGTQDGAGALTEIDADVALAQSWDAAVVIEPLRRRAGLFAWGEFGESRALQNAYCSLFDARYPEWNVRWLARGMEDVRGSLGVTERLTDEVCLLEHPSWNLLAPEDEDPYWNDCWVTLRDPVGQIRHLALSSLNGGAALLRPQHLPLMRRFSETMPGEESIRSGAWIDMTTHEVLLWDVQPQGYLEDHLRPFWHGWRVDRQMDGWRLQAELAGQRVPKRRLERDDLELAAELLAAPAIGEGTTAALRAAVIGTSRDAGCVTSRWSSWSASVAPDLEALPSVVSTALSRR